MIKDIQELNFPKLDGKQYATLSQAVVSIADMGEKNITAQVKIDGNIRPDFSYDWEVVFHGEKYIMPLRKPQGSKGNESLNSEIDLTFQHWAIYQLKRWMFVTMQPIATGTAVADKYIASVSLNLGNFCALLGQVLSYYYGDRITIDLNPEWQYSNEPTVITISHTKIWNVLIDTLQPLYGVRWEMKAAQSNSNTVKGGERYVIKVGYPTTEVNHIFEYGFNGGLLKVERQVQSDEICNMLIGRGGSKNLPYRYFKNTDPNNPSFKADPDWIPELANIYFDRLRGATFRSYVQGWKAKHYGGTTAKADAYAPWAWEKGYTDTKFDPVEYVKDDDSIAEYGPLLDGLEDNDEIFPTIQGVAVSPYGRIDEVIGVEEITSDDVESSVESSTKVTDIKPTNKTEDIGAGAYKYITTPKTSFSVDNGKIANLTAENYFKKGYHYLDNRHSNRKDVSELIVVDAVTVKVYNSNGDEVPSVNIPVGDYTVAIQFHVQNTYSGTAAVTVGCETLNLTSGPVSGADNSGKWKSTWDIWVKNIWGTQIGENETEEQYSERVWGPILGDREGGEARVVFSDGMLSTSEDYEFIIPKGYLPQHDTSRSFDGVQSHWRITLGKSDADLESIGLYVPSMMRFAEAGDHFFFIGIDMPHQYAVWGEERVDDYKTDAMGKTSDIKPAWVVSLDKLRMLNKQEGEASSLLSQLEAGCSLRLADKRFIGEIGTNAYETLYLQSITYTYGDTLIPDVEIVLSDDYEVTANPIALLQGEVSSIQRQIGSISNIEQIVRAVGDRLYLRKDGISDRSLSPTQFFSLLTSADFRAGLIGGAGWGFYKDEDGQWILEADKINARHELQVNNLVINQITAQGGKVIESAASMVVTNVVETSDGYICYFDQKDGTVGNLFHIDDVAMGQVFDANDVQTKFYKRRITGIDVDSITLSKEDAVGGGIPEIGDVIVHYGNYTDTGRQYVKVRDVIGGGYERYIEGLNSVDSDGIEYYFVGKQAGTFRWFIGNKDLVPNSGDGKGSWIEYKNKKFNLNNVSLSVNSTVGDVKIGDYVGQIVDPKIKLIQDQIDGVIETFNGFGAPALNNYPADEWATDEERKRHNRDIYTDITPYVDEVTTPTAGQSWKWYYNSATDYGWTKIADSDAVRALQLASLSVMDTDVLFISHTSQTVAPALPTVNSSGVITNLNGWQTTAPEWRADRYIWQTTYVRKGDGTASFSAPTCIQGAAGESITITDTEVRYSTVHTATQPSDDTFTLTSVPALSAGQYLWSRTKVTYSNRDTTVSYAVSRVGADGTSVSVSSTSVTYAKTTDSVQPADSAFIYSSIGDAGPSVGDYLWAKTVVNYSDGSSTKSYTVSRIGSDGAQGLPGKPGVDGQTSYVHFAYASSADGVTDFSTSYFDGALYIGTCTTYTQEDPATPSSYVWARLKGEDGRGIVSSTEWYAVSNSNVTPPPDSEFDKTIPATTPEKRYLWNYEVTTYSDDTSERTGKRVIGVHGANGTDGAGISSIVNYYLASAQSSGVTTSTAGWTTNASAASATISKEKPYLWNYEVVNYTKGSPTTTVPHIVGKYGDTGRGIASIKEQYYLSTSNTELAGGSWSDTKQDWTAGKYFWTQTVITYTDGTSVTTTPICVTGEKGTDGQSTYLLNIINSMAGIVCDSSGNVTGTYPSPKAEVWQGSVKLTSGVTYSIHSKTGIITATIGNDGTVTLSALGSDTATVTVQAVVNGVALQAVISLYKAKAGANGTSVTVTSTSIGYQSSASGTAVPTGTWSTSVPSVPAGHYLWTRTIVNYSNGQSTTSYSVARQGANGADGVAGVGISSVANKYAVSSSNTTAPTSWQNTAPAMTETNRYLWNYEIITYTNGSTSETDKRVIGVYGNTGSSGAAGKGIQSITEHYLATSASSGVTTSTNGWTTTIQTITSAKKYLWNYETTTFTDGTSTNSTPVIIGVYGDQGIAGADGRGVVSTTVEYQIGTSGTTAPTGTWSTAVPAAQKGKYLWTRTTVTYTSGSPSVLYSVAYYATDGTNGKDGVPGKDGVGIISTTIQYAKSTSNTTAPTSGWQATVPAVPAGQYLWTWTKWKYSDNSEEDGYSVARQGANGADGTSVTITSTEIRYAKGNYPTQPADSAFTLSDIGTLTKGQYLWTRTTVNYSDGVQTKSYTVAYIGSDGSQGLPGTPGADGQTSYVHFAYASGITGSLPHPSAVAGFSTNAFAGAKYIGVCSDYNAADPTTHASYEWSEYKGETGEAAVVYEIEPSTTVVTKSVAGVLSASSVNCTVYKVTGNTARVATNDHTLKYTRYPDGATGTLSRTGGVSSSVAVTKTTTFVVFELYSGSVLLDRERGAVISDASDMEIGGINMIRNSGFTGDYLSEQLSDNVVMEGRTELFSSPFDHWTAVGATVQASTESVSGKEVVLAAGSLTQALYFKWRADTDHVLSFKAKGTGLKVKMGTDAAQDIALTSAWKQYIIPLHPTASENTFAILSATCTLCDLQLQEGNKATSWNPSPWDNQSDRAYYEALWYLSNAMNEGGTSVNPGLILTSHIKVGNYANHEMIKETGGMQGTWVNDNSPFLWGGGTNEEAIAAINAYSSIPSNGKVTGQANFAVTHGGRLIANDAIIRGAIYATRGEFSGTITSNDGNIGGFAIGSNFLKAGTTDTYLNLSGGLLELSAVNTNYHTGKILARCYPPAYGGDSFTSLSVSNTYSGSNVNEGSSLGDPTENNGIAIEVSGATRNHAIKVTKGNFAGLRPFTRVLTAGATLDITDVVVVMNNSSSATLRLPSPAENGHWILLYHTTSNNVSVNGNFKEIRVVRDGTVQGTLPVTNREIWMFLYDGTYWEAGLLTS